MIDWVQGGNGPDQYGKYAYYFLLNNSILINFGCDQLHSKVDSNNYKVYYASSYNSAPCLFISYKEMYIYFNDWDILDKTVYNRITSNTNSYFKVSNSRVVESGEAYFLAIGKL